MYMVSYHLHLESDCCSIFVFFQQACPQQDCNKKVVDQANGFYRCEKCQKEFPDFKYRMILSVRQLLFRHSVEYPVPLLQANCADYSENHWITCFQESAESILGVSADELGRLRTEVMRTSLTLPRFYYSANIVCIHRMKQLLTKFLRMLFSHHISSICEPRWRHTMWVFCGFKGFIWV
jgi:hypothetical protein